MNCSSIHLEKSLKTLAQTVNLIPKPPQNNCFRAITALTVLSASVRKFQFTLRTRAAQWTSGRAWPNRIYAGLNWFDLGPPCLLQVILCAKCNYPARVEDLEVIWVYITPAKIKHCLSCRYLWSVAAPLQTIESPLVQHAQLSPHCSTGSIWHQRNAKFSSWRCAQTGQKAVKNNDQGTVNSHCCDVASITNQIPIPSLSLPKKSTNAKFPSPQ